MSTKFDPDTPIWGARTFALVLGLVDAKGKPKTRTAYHLLESGRLNGVADKVGKTWTSTPRRLRSIANGGAA